jgi:hypothetical protein
MTINKTQVHGLSENLHHFSFNSGAKNHLLHKLNVAIGSKVQEKKNLPPITPNHMATGSIKHGIDKAK